MITTAINHAAIARLLSLGWLDRTHGRTDAMEAISADPVTVRQTVLEYQGWWGLERSGEIDPPTLRHMDLPRFCPLPDRMEQRNTLCRWPETRITWSILGYLPERGSQLTRQMQLDTFAAAWQHWADVIGIEPVYEENNPRANVTAEPADLGGVGGTLADSMLPCWQISTNAGHTCRQRYDRAETYVTLASPRWPQVGLGPVITHELGHALGIFHLAAGNLMAPIYNPDVGKPQAGDIAEGRLRYPAPRPRPVDPTPEPGPRKKLIVTGLDLKWEPVE